jgi:hypothetical protein
MGPACGLEKLAQYPATHLDQKPHSPGLVTVAVNVVGYSNDLAWTLETAVVEEMRGFQERVGLGTTDRGVKKDLLG